MKKRKTFLTGEEFLLFRKILRIMKLTTFLVFATTLMVSASVYSQNTRLNLKFESIPFGELFQEIEKQTEFRFAFSNSKLDSKQKIKIDSTDETLENILDKVLPEGITYDIIDRYVVILNAWEKKFIVERQQQQQQQPAVSGKITDQSGQPLPGVTVVVKGSTQGTVTNADGNYSLTNIPENAMLVFSFVGMRTQEIAVGSQSIINITLSEDVRALEEVVVVGYGTMRKSDLTGSIGSVNSEQLEKHGGKVNVLQALQGMLPGLNIQHAASSASNDSYNIIIRGQNSIKASNTPLIILDGVPWDGGLNEIHQGDIQSIEVLKDASSAAIYGARGANGVILITTKKGKEGKPSIRYEGNYGFQQIDNLPPVLSGEEWWDVHTERLGDVYINNWPTIRANHEARKEVDWLDLVTRTGQEQKHNLSLRGGNQNVLYYVSGTYSGVKGIALGDDFKEAVVRTNLTVNITDWLSVGTNSQYTYIDRSGLSPDINNAYRQNPYVNPYADDGTYALRPWPEEVFFDNPLTNLYVLDENYAQRLFSNNFLDIKLPFIKGFSFKLNTGYTAYNARINRFHGNNTLTGIQNDGRSYSSDQWNKNSLMENIFYYQKTMGDHYIHFTGLYSTQRTSSEGRNLSAQQFPSNVLTWYQTNVAGSLTPNTSYRKTSYISQMARLVYSFQSNYLLTATVRRDGYSGFGADNKFGIFPSFALGWNISNEQFMQPIDWISYLKLKFSYGRNGNQAINPYETMAKLQSMPYLGGEFANSTLAGYYPSSLATPSLTWETSETFNAGVDFQLIKSRISGNLDVYRTKSYDLLMDRSISSIHGITSIVQNIGSTQNTGLEIFIRSINVQKSDFFWNTEMSFAHNKNKIVDLYGDKTTEDPSNKWFIGKPIDVNWDYVFDGVWQIGEDNAVQPQAIPGDVKVKDTNKDGEITPDDRDFMGQISPLYRIGLTNTVGYKNFTFSFSLYSPLGATRMNPIWNTDVAGLMMRENVFMMNWWREDNPTNEYPANRNNTNPYLVRFYQNSSYLRLNDVTISYKLPDRMRQSIGLKNLELYGNVRNAFTITKWKGMDPELSDQRGVPLDRTYMIGLKIEL